MTEPQAADQPDQTDQPHHMAHTESESRPTTPEVPPVPGADVDSDELSAGSGRQAGAPPQQAESPDTPAAPQPKDEVTSPELEHLDQTIERAHHAADEALAPQRE